MVKSLAVETFNAFLMPAGIFSIPSVMAQF
jgi:hypothetical protein